MNSHQRRKARRAKMREIRKVAFKFMEENRRLIEDLAKGVEVYECCQHKLELVPAREPWAPEHYICTLCDGTFTTEGV